MHGFGEGFGTDDHEVNFVTVEFEKSWVHSSMRVVAVMERVEIELDVVCVAMELKTMAADDITKGENV